MPKNKKTRVSAFTLIELLVVIAIIGILSSVVLAALSGARESARDTKRQQDIRQIRTAIQMYMNDNSGNPPLAGNDNWYTSSQSGEWSDLKNALEPEYINTVPVDPLNESPFQYEYRAGGTDDRGDCDFDYGEDSYEFAFAVETGDPGSGYSYFDQHNGESRYCVIE